MPLPLFRAGLIYATNNFSHYGWFAVSASLGVATTNKIDRFLGSKGILERSSKTQRQHDKNNFVSPIPKKYIEINLDADKTKSENKLRTDI